MYSTFKIYQLFVLFFQIGGFVISPVYLSTSVDGAIHTLLPEHQGPVVDMLALCRLTKHALVRPELQGLFAGSRHLSNAPEMCYTRS